MSTTEAPKRSLWELFQPLGAHSCKLELACACTSLSRHLVIESCPAASWCPQGTCDAGTGRQLLLANAQLSNAVNPAGGVPNSASELLDGHLAGLSLRGVTLPGLEGCVMLQSRNLACTASFQQLRRALNPAGGVPESASELLDGHPAGLSLTAVTLPGLLALEGPVMLQFRNMASTTTNLQDCPFVGVPAYADALLVRPLLCGSSRWCWVAACLDLGTAARPWQQAYTERSATLPRKSAAWYATD